MESRRLGTVMATVGFLLPLEIKQQPPKLKTFSRNNLIYFITQLLGKIRSYLTIRNEGNSGE